MDTEVDSAWICTQAVVNTDSQSDNERGKINNYGYIVLNDMIDNERYILKEGDNTIGRHPLNHIYIEHPSVSMNHAVIQCDSDGVVLLDKGSLNKTKINKKILKKDVAYFLEENALLVFGEVRADYFVNERSNDTEPMVPENTNFHKETQNDMLSLSKSSNAVINPKSFRTDTPSSTCKLEKEIPKNVTGTECALNKTNDIHTKLNSSSPSDEYLLEALSQIEAKQNNANSNEIFYNLSNKDTLIMDQTEPMPEMARVDTPSPVMNLENSILTTDDAIKNQFQSPNKINTDIIREDTPSPVMDLKRSFLIANNIKKNIFQSPSEINTELIREDTPSPIMDLGCYNDFENNLETNNHGIFSVIQSPNKVDEFDNTQVLEIDNSIVELQTQTSNNDNILLSEPQKVELCNKSNTSIRHYSDIHSNDNLSGSKNTNLNAKCSVKLTEHFCRKNDGLTNDKHEKIVNTFEADDDDVFRHFIENECKSQQHDLAMENQDFFNCPTQKISINKNINTKSKLTSSIHNKETQRSPEFKQLNKTNTITSNIYCTNIHEDLTDVPDMDDDFFNCPTQKLSITKKINPQPKVSSTICDEETQELLEIPKTILNITSSSKSYTISKHEDLNQIPDIDTDFSNCPTQNISITKKIQPKVISSINDEETQKLTDLSKPIKNNACATKSVHEDLTQIPKTDDDFFNCPTQKISKNKNIFSKPKLSPSIHEEETQIPSELTQPNKTKTFISKTCSTNIHGDLTEVPDMDDDFFNCPTQKLSITKKINPQPKVSSSIHDAETQDLLEFLKPGKSNSILSKSDSTSIHEENTQIPKIDDDFFNCSTQKLSITKKINPQPKISSSIHDAETQDLLEFSKPDKSNSILSNSDSTSIHEENTQIPKIDDDDFNCPTQKVSINKNIYSKPKLSPSIHEEETQIPSELTQPNKTKTFISKTYSTNIHGDLTEVPDMDDDFFNCPTQKLSITKKINPQPKVSSSIHDAETQDLLEFLKPGKSNSILSKSVSTSIHEENTQIPKIDDDFFNCPTQKLSITKKINPQPKVSSSIHDAETQDLLEFLKPGKSNSILSKSVSTSIHEENTQIPKIDDDFFNCPTQKLSITKKINPQPKVSSSIHDAETQDILEFLEPGKCNSIMSKSDSTSMHVDTTQIPKIDDDFFNCPTQKVSINKNIFSKPKLSPSIHEEETQIPSELTQPNKTKTITSMTYSTNILEDLTEVPDMDNDFFNCPTQKLSITKKINPQPKVSSSINDAETQDLLKFSKPDKSYSILSNSDSTSIHEENTQIPKIDDDFFNCPTQKVSINKNIFSKPKLSPSIHEEETQIPSELTQPNKTKTITSKTYSTNMLEDLTEVPDMDDDFFNCPTQKLSITKKINPQPKVSSTICDEETQELLEIPKPILNITTSSKSYTISKHEDSNQIPIIDDDFFNCPTQKIPVSKKINLPNVFSTIHEENTQKPPEVTQLNKTNINISKTVSTNKHKDFFSSQTQTVLSNSNSNISISCRKHESVPTITNGGETQDSLMQSISKINLPSNLKHDEGNIVNSTTQKVLTKVQSNSISKCSINMNEVVTMNPKHFDESNNHKQTAEPDNEDRCKVQKSKCVKSDSISLSNVQPPVICNEKSSNNLRINKPKIRVREDLHIVSCSSVSSNNSSIILNKSNQNSVFNSINTTVPLNKNFDSPGCSKSITNKKNDLNSSSSTNQKHFTDDSLQSQVSTSLKYNHQIKQLNESIFSPLNIPDVSGNSLLEHQSSPKTTENNLNALNCEPSTSSNNAFEWKSFWHKKKVQSLQDNGKNNKQKSIKIIPENKERYQTRALTRKRKQNCDVESNKKICNRSKILEPLVENSSEVVVSFSYLKSRHLQEMKQFVEKTGGTVTDEITQCSVLVTDKIRCTMKILSAIARGCPIVNANWVKHSYTVKKFQDVDDFIIVDKDAERKYKFQLKESLAKAKTKRLFDGYNVLVTPSVKPGPQEMKVIITCAGGNYVLNWTTTQYSKELIVTCDKDLTRWKSAWDNDSAKIIDCDTLVTSIIRQKLIM
ncbi:hypothetical protein ACI65C_008224 [Semiaphis heraclei]